MKILLLSVLSILLLAGCTDYRAHMAYEVVPGGKGSENKIDDDFIACYREANDKAWAVNDTANNLLAIGGGGLIGGAIGGAVAGGIVGGGVSAGSENKMSSDDIYAYRDTCMKKRGYKPIDKE